MDANRHVLVVEDEPLIGMLLEAMLTELGYRLVGPVGSLDEALHAAERPELDLALLDINLGQGDTSFAVADRLRERGIPYAFVTGYGAAGLSPEHAQARVLHKPFARTELRQLLQWLAG